MNATRVSIFINEADTWEGRALHVALLEVLGKGNIAGATVVRGVAGYTRASGTAKSADTGGMLPLVLEFVDEEALVANLLPAIQGMVGNRLIVTSPVEIRHGGAIKQQP